MKDIWKDIPEYEGFYRASRFGEIKSLPRNGTVKNEKILKGGIDGGGYRIFNLSKEGKNCTKTLHRLIATTFIQNPMNLPEVNHINGNKLDNRVENLEWCTRSQNMKHAFDNKLNTSHFISIRLLGKDNPNSKKVICIGLDSIEKEYDSITDASKSENVSITSIANNLKGESKYCGNKLKFRYA